MRLVCAIFVMFIHVPFPGTIGAEICQFGRSAVPFFLMVSGYYATPQSAGKRLWSTVRLAGIALVFYFVVNSACRLAQGGSALDWLANSLNFDVLIRFLLINRLSFFSSIMYYFFMLIYVYIIYCAVVRWRTRNYLEWLVLPLLLAGIGLCYLNQPWYYAGNWLFTGLPFFYMGQIISRHSELQRYANVCAIFGVCFSIAEGLLGEFYISLGSAALSVGAFLLCIRYPSLVGVSMAEWCRRISLPVFIIHCGVRDVMQLFLPHDLWFFPLAVLLVSFVISAGIVGTSKWIGYTQKREQNYGRMISGR